MAESEVLTAASLSPASSHLVHVLAHMHDTKSYEYLSISGFTVNTKIKPNS